MADPLATIVTRPRSFDPADDYALVVARGDYPLGDYDINDVQAILRQDMAAFMRLMLVDGSAAIEAGGTIGSPQAGTIVGGDSLGSAGTYKGVESQVYTIRVLTGGAAGTATFSWSSTGNDGPPYDSAPVPITAIATSLIQAAANPQVYGHAVGVLGVLVYFISSGGQVHGGSTWAVQATYGANLPTVSGATITVPDVLVPVQGRIHRAAGAALTYAAASSGVSIVYAEWTRTLVTDSEDSGLTDPLSQDPQAFRERWRVVLRSADTSANPLGAALERRVFPLYQWDRATNIVTRVVKNPYAIDIGKTQGALTGDRLLNIDQSVVFQGILATRTREPLESFVVSPVLPAPRAWLSTNAPTAGKLRLSLPPIVAYVEGVRIEKPAPSDIEIDQATDYLSIADEAFTFSTGTNLYSLVKGLAGFPIKAITKVTGYVAVTNVSVTRGSGPTDTLPYSNVISVQAIRRLGTTFVAGVDYSVAGNIVTWITPDVGAANPTASQSYDVDLTYNKTMAPGTDYQLTGNQLDFSPSGDNPVNGTQPQVDYQYYLPRIDVLVLRPTGAVDVVRGTPAEVALVPTLPQFTLTYAQINVPPNSSTPTILSAPNDRVTMAELNQMRALIRELFVNFAQQDLANQARTLNTARLLDVFAEAFATELVADVGYNAGGHVFDATIDTELQQLTLPFTEVLRPLSYQSSGSTVRQGTTFFTLPYTDELAVDAPRWSTDYPVNPYADFTPEPALMGLTPAQDFWIDTTTLSSTRSRTVQNGRHINNRVVRRYTTTSESTRDVPAQFMRQITVRVEGQHFVPGERVRLLFDGKLVSALTAASPSTQGPDAATIVARPSDATHRYGDVAATFAVPANVPAGTVPVALYGDNASGAAWPGGYTKRAEATYTSNGVERTVTAETTRVTVRNDPVAQSIVFPAARMISKVSTPVMAAPTPSGSAPPLIFELRATDNSGEASTPTSEVLSRVVRHAAEALASGVWTLPEPVYTPANIFRSIVLRSASNAYRIGVAQLGGPDRANGGFVSSQQIPGGIFLDSSNNSDWTPHQGWDMRCQVYVAKMSSTTGTLRLAQVVQANTTGFYLTVDQVIPPDTAIQWQYSTDGGATWTNCEPFTLTELGAVTSQLDFRALLSTTNSYVSPVIHQKNLQVAVYSNKLAGKYISTLFALPSAATSAHITGRLEVLEPAGASATVVYVSVDDGATWSVATLTTKGTLADGFVVKEFDKTALTPGTRLRLRLDLGTGNRAVRPRARRLFAYAV